MPLVAALAYTAVRLPGVSADGEQMSGARARLIEH